ncbi:hypothetical protein, partial [Ruminococcus sp.]
TQFYLEKLLIKYKCYRQIGQEVFMKHNYEFVNFKLLMLSLFVFAGIITGIRVAFETNSEMQIKIFISWFFVKALIILANVNYIKKSFHKLSDHGDSCFSQIEMLRNTYIIGCAVTAIVLLVFCKI